MTAPFDHHVSSKPRCIRPRPLRIVLLVLLVAIGLMLGPRVASGAVPCTVNWDGGAGTDLWNDAANWTGDSVPAPTDYVCIPDTVLSQVRIDSSTTATIQAVDSSETLRIEGALSLTDAGVDSSVSNLEIAGTLDGSGTLTVDGSLTWIGGSMVGSGTTVIAPTGTLSIDAGNLGAVAFGSNLGDGPTSPRVLDKQGTATGASGYIYAGSGSLLENAGTFNAQSETGYLWAAGATPPAIHNTGTFRKTVGSGTTAIGATFDNDGSTSVSSGELALQAGDGPEESTGSFTAAAGAVLSFTSGDFDLAASSSIGGVGTVRVPGGSVTVAGTFAPANAEVSGGRLTLNADATPHDVTISCGILDGSGTLTVDGSLTWIGGSMVGSGTTVIAPTGTLSIDAGNLGAVAFGYNLFDGTTSPRVLDNQGTATWASGYIYAGSGSLLENAGTFNAQSETGYLWAAGATPPAIHNTGTFAGIAELQADV